MCVGDYFLANLEPSIECLPMFHESRKVFGALKGTTLHHVLHVYCLDVANLRCPGLISVETRTPFNSLYDKPLKAIGMLHILLISRYGFVLL